MLLLFLVAVSLAFLSGCRAVATIFEAGLVVGIVVVLIVLLLVGFVVSRMRRG